MDQELNPVELCVDFLPSGIGTIMSFAIIC